MVYLDHAATSYPKPPCVLRAVEEALLSAGNPGRGSHSLSHRAGEYLLSAREALCRVFHTEDPFAYVFALNASDALNLVLQGVPEPGTTVLTGPMEHNSVLRPLETMKSRGLVDWELLPADPFGRIDPEALRARLAKGGVSLVALQHASNLTGVLQPVEAAVEAAREAKVPILIDGSQAAGHLDVDLSRLRPDFYAFPGHKGLLGPQGTGGLFLGGAYWPRALRQGGTGSQSDSLLQPEDLPERYEVGTQATPALAGLAAGIRFFCDYRQEILGWEGELYRELRDGVLDLEAYDLPGLPETGTPCAPVLSLVPKTGDPTALANRLTEEFGIACRAGLHCAPLAHRHLGTFPQGAVRLSLGALSQRRDVRAALRALAVCAKG